MATNNFKSFGIGAGANVTSQSDYEALAALLTGFQSGKASSAQINKALRQSSTMAYVLAQFISDSASVDVLDNGAPATILANLKSAMTALTPGRLLNVQVFTSSGTYTKTSGAKKAIAKVQAAGGAAGGIAATSGGSNYVASSSGGTAGAYGETNLIDLNSVSTIPVTVGVGGQSAVNTDGAAGGLSAFGSYLSAPGGAGSSAGPANATQVAYGTDLPASGSCTGTSVAFNIPGKGGSGALASTSSSSAGIKSGAGGDSFMGRGGRSKSGLGTIAENGSGYGSGGGGNASGSGATTGFAGGNGANGIVIVLEYA